MNRGGAAAGTWIVCGDESRRHRGRDVNILRRRVQRCKNHRRRPASRRARTRAGTLRIVGLFAELVKQSATSREEVVEADALVRKYIEIVRRVFGQKHPLARMFLDLSGDVRAKLESFPA